MRVLIFTLAVLGIGPATAADIDKPRYEEGMASLYWQPQKVACAGKVVMDNRVVGYTIPPRLDPAEMTAAHKTLPCGTVVRVTNKRTGQSTVVMITDRGPFAPGVIIDLTPAAGDAIGLTYGRGRDTVRLEWGELPRNLTVRPVRPDTLQRRKR